MQQRYISISRFLSTFIVIAMIPVVVTTYVSVSQADRIEEQAERQNQINARQEFFTALSKIEQRTINIADNLATWDETILNFSDPTYYRYWKENRLHDAAILDHAVEAVELYGAAGAALESDNDIAATVLPQAVGAAVVMLKGKVPFMVYFRPVYFQSAPEGGAKADGYLAVSVNITRAITAQGVLSRSDHRAVNWPLRDGEVIPLQDAMRGVSLDAYRSPEVDAFYRLVQHRFGEYVFFSIALLATFSLLLITAFGRPLQRMASHIRAMHHGEAEEIPESIQSPFKVTELEQVRQAVNDYRRKFHRAKDSLIEKNLKLEQLTYRDVLTGAFNRRAFESHVTRALESAGREDKPHALFYMDLDQFKVVNDTCGHVAGDELLRQIAARLQLTLREADILARLGGDEFGVLLYGCPIDKAGEIAEELRQAVKSLRFVWENKVFDIGVSIGLVAINEKSACLADVLKAADAACYMAKDLGRNRIHVYQHDDKDLVRRYGEMQWVSKITQALDEGRFALYCQPIVPTADDGESQLYLELLIRMLDDRGQPVPPMAFLPAAERYNLIGSIDRWVFSALCDVVKTRRRYFEARQSILAINLSGQSLGDAGFLGFVIERLEQTQIDPRLFCFEVTETAAITHLVSAKRFIDTLRRKGCRFALDDFGSGLSSFAYLKNLQVDCLKIDGHFVKNMVDDPVDRAMVAAINQVGHLMNMQTIAEFVETPETFAALKEMGVDFVQGYCVAKPMPFVAMLERIDDEGIGARDIATTSDRSGA